MTNIGAVNLLLPYVPHILELVQRCLADEEKPETVVRLSMGLVGDLADAFATGQIKHLLLAEWLVQALRSKTRVSTDTKRTIRWAREVGYLSHSLLPSIVMLIENFRWSSVRQRRTLEFLCKVFHCFP